jgi:serine/threonine protein kinase
MPVAISGVVLEDFAMTAKSDDTRTDSCPSHDKLAAFSRSELPAAAWESIVEHLARCSRCEHKLRHLDELECPFLPGLRTRIPDDPILNEPECRHLEEAARAIAEEAFDSPPPNSSFFPPFPKLTGFECRDLLGKGPSGKVYRARKMGSEGEFAIKAIPVPFPLNERKKERFLNEVRRASELTKGVIPKVLDLREDEGCVLLITPFFAGAALSQIIAGRKALQSGKRLFPIHPFIDLSEAEYVRQMLPLIGKIVAALGRIHEAQLLHGNLTTSNIFVEGNGDVRVLDFGLPRLTGTWGGVRFSGFEQLVSGMNGWKRDENFQVGHPGFVSPEEWEGHTRLDQRADVFQMGVTVYQALTLKLPFGTSPLSSRSQAPPAPSTIQPSLLPAIDAVLEKALAPDREKRYRSAVEFSEDWRQAGPTGPLVKAPVSGWQAGNMLSWFSSLGKLSQRLRDFVR